MTASCAPMTAARLDSIASSHEATNPSGLSATPSRDNSSYATTLRMHNTSDSAGTRRSAPHSHTVAMDSVQEALSDEVPLRLLLVRVGGAAEPDNDAKPRVGDLPLHLLRREPVDVEFDANGSPAPSKPIVTRLERRREVASRPDDPRQLTERPGPIRRCEIHERVPAHDPGQRGVLERKIPYIGHVEGKSGVIATRDADHPRGQVDAVGLQSPTGEIGRQSSWAASDITDRRPNAVLDDQVAEQAEHGSVDRHLIENVGELLGVEVGPRIMGVAQFFGLCVHAGRLATKADNGSRCYRWSGWGTARTSSPSMPAKSSGLHVYSGMFSAMAVAAIKASYAFAAGMRPTDRSDAATRPKALAAFESNAIASKSVSACCRCACRATRSFAVRATCGPADSSPSVTALMTDSSGRFAGSSIRPSRITVDVSSIPRMLWAVTGRRPAPSRDRYEARRDRLSVGGDAARRDRPLTGFAEHEDVARQPRHHPG